MRVADVMRQVPAIRASDRADDAAKALHRAGASALPVLTDDGAVIGVVLAQDLPGAPAPGADLADESRSLTAGHVMSGKLHTVGPDARVAEVAGLMVAREIRHVPVVDPDRRLVGMITDRDIREQLGVDLRDWPGAGGSLDNVAANVMTPDPLFVRTDTPLLKVFDILESERIGAVPVCNDRDEVVGMLSYLDVLHWLHRALRRSAAPRPAEAPAASR